MAYMHGLVCVLAYLQLYQPTRRGSVSLRCISDMYSKVSGIQWPVEG